MMIPEYEIKQIEELLAAASKEEFEVGATNHASIEAAAEAQGKRLSLSPSLTEWSVVFRDHEKARGYVPNAGNDFVYVCVTGNGPTSEGNARFFSMSRRIIEDLLVERAELLQEINELHLK